MELMNILKKMNFKIVRLIGLLFVTSNTFANEVKIKKDFRLEKN